MTNRTFSPSNFEKKSDFIIRMNNNKEVRKKYSTFTERYNFAVNRFNLAKPNSIVYIKAWNDEFLVY